MLTDENSALIDLYLSIDNTERFGFYSDDDSVKRKGDINVVRPKRFIFTVFSYFTYL